jgi:hypothetical protein
MPKKDYILFDKDTQSFIYNLQVNAVQRMLDFDYVSGRKTPSVAAIVNPTGSDGFQIRHQATLKKVMNDRRASLDEDTEIKPTMIEKISNLKPHQVCRLGIGRTFQVVKPFLNWSILAAELPFTLQPPLECLHLWRSKLAEALEHNE